MFAPTLPQGAPDLMRASEFRHYLAGSDANGGGSGPEASAARLTSLSPSLLMDLMRFERRGQKSELLEVLAACLRHTQALAIHLQWGEQVLTLTVFPIDRLAHCQVPMERLLNSRLSEVAVLQVEPATLRAPGDKESSLVGEWSLYAPLAPVLWMMAMHGARADLLPEIAGQAAYRVSPGVNLGGLSMTVPVANCVQRLRRQTCNLRQITVWPGIDRGCATRVLNALYLQAGLIVSRTHPAATNEGWFGYH